MKIRRGAAVMVMVVALVGLLGCSDTGDVGNVGEGKGQDMGLTWQEAKADTQKMELEIADLIPPDKIVSIEQKETGMLLSCSKTEHNWNGGITVTVVPGVEVEPIVKDIEEHYQDSRFDIKTRLNVVGKYQVQLRSPDTAEIYIITEGFTPDAIRIVSGSVCFTLPEGVYPGGDF
ncbi:hypothetical protein GCM10022198_06360 [Klugiella xanthotipulae]|uniref:LppA-like lipoprotein n=1 Tax=Klugiella xanthotipulae TaxID=244735 RepID=A0A543I5X5_9MICO|nr:hypothetical protein [Klugiella xanthotipulae]TQM66003.1 hypothetical protein FB466_0824 [Klugiella xanthotipulae]